MSTANAAESIFPGGEVEFVRHMIADSLQLKQRVRSVKLNTAALAGPGVAG